MDYLERNKTIVKQANNGQEKPSYTFKEVIHFMSHAVTKRKPTFIKRGDVCQGSAFNFKMRPFVVAKVTKAGCYCIPLTTGEDSYSTVPYKSRFFSDGFLGNTFYLLPEEVVLETFIGVFDDSKSLNKAINLISIQIVKSFT